MRRGDFVTLGVKKLDLILSREENGEKKLAYDLSLLGVPGRLMVALPWLACRSLR